MSTINTVPAISILDVRTNLDSRDADTVLVQVDDRTVWMTRSELVAASRHNDPAGYAYRWILSQLEQFDSGSRLLPSITVTLAGAIEAGRHLAQQQAAAEIFRQERASEQLRNAAELARVKGEQATAGKESTWWPIVSYQLPDGLRFDVWRPTAGSCVETAYGTFSRGEAGSSDPYMRIVDHSEPTGSPARVRYYRRRDTK